MVDQMTDGRTVFTPAILDTVTCPKDRGDDEYKGTVMAVADAVEHNHLGEPFRWVTVRHPRGHNGIWPSNRLKAA